MYRTRIDLTWLLHDLSSPSMIWSDPWHDTTWPGLSCPYMTWPTLTGKGPSWPHLAWLDQACKAWVDLIRRNRRWSDLTRHDLTWNAITFDLNWPWKKMYWPGTNWPWHIRRHDLFTWCCHHLWYRWRRCRQLRRRRCAGWWAWPQLTSCWWQTRTRTWC